MGVLPKPKGRWRGSAQRLWARTHFEDALLWRLVSSDQPLPRQVVALELAPHEHEHGDARTGARDEGAAPRGRRSRAARESDLPPCARIAASDLSRAIGRGHVHQRLVTPSPSRIAPQPPPAPRPPARPPPSSDRKLTRPLQPPPAPRFQKSATAPSCGRTSRRPCSRRRTRSLAWASARRSRRPRSPPRPARARAPRRRPSPTYVPRPTASDVLRPSRHD